MKRFFAIFMGITMLSLVAVGCAEEKSMVEDPVVEDGVEEEADSDQDSDMDENVDNDGETESENDDIAKVYLPNRDATELVEVEIESEEDKSVEESIIDELKQERAEEVDYTRAIKDGIEVNSVTVEGTMAIVDFSSENLNGGSTEEVFMIDSIVKSLTSLENIDSVQFLVDGQKADTLMGHMSIADPYTAEDISSDIE